MSKFDSKFKVGDKVILGEHQAGPGFSKNWDHNMAFFIGKEAILLKKVDMTYCKDEPCQLWQVDIDKETWQWREENMILASKVPSLEFKKVDIKSTAPAINDMSCPTCGNTKCSSSEQNCWWCGNSLH